MNDTPSRSSTSILRHINSSLGAVDESLGKELDPFTSSFPGRIKSSIVSMFSNADGSQNDSAILDVELGPKKGVSI